MDEIQEKPSEVTDIDLIGLFMSTGMTTFGGGVLPHLSLRLLQKKWLSESTYLEALNWAQCVPGSNGTNIASYLGWQFRGLRGAVILPVALLIPGVAIMLLASSFLPVVPERVIHNISQSALSVVVGLILAMVWKISIHIRKDIWQSSIAVLVFILVGVARFPMPLVLIFALVTTGIFYKDENLT